MERIGHYKVISELGRGGMGVVFKAWDPLTQSHVAIKLLLAAHNPKRLSRFKREVQVLQRLQHPNVVPIRNYGEEGGRPYLVMSLVDGKSLDSLIEERGPLPPSMVAEIGQKLASALAAGHELGILHRDVKPDNVLLRADGEVVLGDFGLAKDVALDESQLTVEGGFLGTPGFVAPEQAMGEANLVGPASDVYGLGATLYYALTGKPPVEGHTVFEIMTNMHRPPTRIRSLRSDVPKELALLVQRCLKPELRDRYRSCVVLERDLDDYLRGSSRHATPGAASTRPLPWTVLAGVLLAAGLLVAVAIALRGAGTLDASPTPDPSVPIERIPDTAVAEALADARASVERGDWDAAAAGYQQVLVLEASNADALHGLWEAFMQIKDPQYLECLRRAVDVEPRPDACLRMGVVYALQEKHKEALSVLRRGLALAPDDPGLLEGVGRGLAGLERYEEAFPYLERAWKAEATAGRGIALTKCCLNLKRLEEALPVIERVVELQPESIEALYLQGFFLFKLSRYEEALDVLSRVWEQTQGSHMPTVRPLAVSLREVGQAEASLRVINIGLQAEPQNIDLLFVRSSTYDELGRIEDELADLDAILAFDPNHLVALNNRSLTLFDLGRYEQSLADAELLVKLEPSTVSGLVQVGACKAKLKDYAGSRDAYARVAEIEPENVGARVGRSQAHHNMKDYEAAIADYTWVLARQPDQHSIRLNLGFAYSSSGAKELARKVMRDLQSRTEPGQHHHTRATKWLTEDAKKQLNPPE